MSNNVLKYIRKTKHINTTLLVILWCCVNNNYDDLKK